jgi:hypothetical protein
VFWNFANLVFWESPFHVNINDDARGVNRGAVSFNSLRMIGRAPVVCLQRQGVYTSIHMFTGERLARRCHFGHEPLHRLFRHSVGVPRQRREASQLVHFDPLYPQPCAEHTTEWSQIRGSLYVRHRIIPCPTRKKGKSKYDFNFHCQACRGR